MTRAPQTRARQSRPYFTVLGTLAAHRDGVRLPLGPLKQRLVLGLLLSRPNTPVGTDALTDAVWPDDPPRTARKNLQVYISSLRTLLGDGATAAPGLLVHDCGGYVLRVEDDEVDALRMRRLARSAEGLEPQAAVAPLREAVGLWQGTPLHDLRRSPALAAEGDRLERRCLSVHEEWAECELALGRGPAVAEELRELAERHPLRERLHTAWMTALHQSGRRAEALAVYDEYRQELARELGLEPGGAMADRYRAVLCAERPRAAVRPATPAPLPPDPPGFTGRGAQLRDLLDTLDRPAGQGGTVLLTGPAGSGKTALAVRAARLLADRYPDGCFLVRLRDGTGAVLPATAVLDRLARLTGVPAAPDAWHRWLVRHRALVVLDDAPGEYAVRGLLAPEGRSDVLVTARGLLGGLAPVGRVDVPPMDPAEALDLLARFVGTARVAADRAAALRVVHGCGLLPLGVRVAGMRLAVLRHLPLAEYADRLADPASALDELAAGDVVVRDRLTVAWCDLPPPQADALARLAAAGPPGPFTLTEAAEALGSSAREAVRIVETLIGAGAVTIPGGEITAHAALYEIPRLVWLFAREDARARAAGTGTGGGAGPAAVAGRSAAVGSSISRSPEPVGPEGHREMRGSSGCGHIPQVSQTTGFSARTVPSRGI
ncbi:AfsR/SARP family transcriptional regulator [Streptomyces sp. TP-A0874]|uniref:AfsR/SARP family transcriptional regulator n=1 Tax=Streptomyces sp. TP-A0874 TaxID=549819 RepID=UPI000A588CF8|nr:BTAD domain-containing putative transcriptional regulator [Streptomyces sp. TP-A0874]